MDVVYFPEELHARAPAAVGVLYFVATHEWGTLFNVVDAVRAGEVVTIRQATSQEVARAEKRVGAYEAGVQLGAQVAALLDHEPPEVIAAHCSKLAEAVKSVPTPMLPDLVQEAEPEAATTQAIEGDPLDALPLLYAMLRDAYIAGDRDAVVSLDRSIQEILLGSATAQAVANAAFDRARASAAAQ